MSNYKIETKCIQSGYKPENGEARVLPIYQSTTYKYDSSEHLGDLFDLKAPGHMYSRISNPTLSCVEEKIADMEGGVGAALNTFCFYFIIAHCYHPFSVYIYNKSVTSTEMALFCLSFTVNTAVNTIFLI